jgi:hypothetical protein
MNIEERLRDAFGSAAETVEPQTIRPCPGPPPRRQRLLTMILNGCAGLRARGVRNGQVFPAVDRPGRPRLDGSRRPAGSGRRVLVPVATAAAVAVIVAGASIAVSVLLTGGNTGAPGSSARTTSGGAAATAVPRYFVTAAGDGSALTVHAIWTGSVTGRLAPPRGTFFPAVAATSNDQAFVVAVEPSSGPCDASLYRMRLDSQGRPGHLAPLGITVPGTFSGSGDLAVTPDGGLAAYATYHCGQGTGEVGVINLATRQARKWTTAVPENPANLSLTADGRLLSFTDYLPGGTVPLPGAKPGEAVRGPVTIVLATDAPTGAARVRGRVVLGTVGAQAISADGTKLYACAAPEPRPALAPTPPTKVTTTLPSVPPGLTFSAIRITFAFELHG